MRWCGWICTFHFLTSLYCFIYYFTENIYSSYFLKDSLRFWNKNMLLAASANFIKSCTLARNTDMKDADEKPRNCFGFFFFQILFRKCKNVLRTQPFPEFSIFSFPSDLCRGQPFMLRASRRDLRHPLHQSSFRAGLRLGCLHPAPHPTKLLYTPSPSPYKIAWGSGPAGQRCL